jgi:hypothetical protein
MLRINSLAVVVAVLSGCALLPQMPGAGSDNFAAIHAQNEWAAELCQPGLRAKQFAAFFKPIDGYRRDEPALSDDSASPFEWRLSARQDYENKSKPKSNASVRLNVVSRNAEERQRHPDRYWDQFLKGSPKKSTIEGFEMVDDYSEPHRNGYEEIPGGGTFIVTIRAATDAKPGVDLDFSVAAVTRADALKFIANFKIAEFAAATADMTNGTWADSKGIIAKYKAAAGAVGISKRNVQLWNGLNAQLERVAVAGLKASPTTCGQMGKPVDSSFTLTCSKVFEEGKKKMEITIHAPRYNTGIHWQKPGWHLADDEGVVATAKEVRGHLVQTHPSTPSHPGLVEILLKRSTAPLMFGGDITISTDMMSEKEVAVVAESLDFKAMVDEIEKITIDES